MTLTEHERGAKAGSGGASRPRPRRGILATTVSVFGELLITVGLVLALFVAYSLWWTNVQANRAAGKMSDQLRDGWEDQSPGELDIKGGLGFLHVPSMGKNILVKKGTEVDELNDGIAGYYTKPVKSAMPWDAKGNFTLAAHRDGHGAKFHNVHKIKEGDPIVFETKDTWYIYKTFKKLPSTSKYNVEVLNPVPKGSGKKKAGQYITLSTCTPIYTSNYRYIVWGELVRSEPVDNKRTPPAELR